MTPDQIEAWGVAALGLMTACATAAARWLTRSGRLIRRLRAAIEKRDEVIYATRQIAIGKGAKRADLPRLPYDPEMGDDDEA